MYTGIHSPKQTIGGNKGSSRNLVEYLTKEDNYKQESTFFSNEIDKEKEEVINHLDEMGKGLKKNEAKFFMLSINPSPKEQEHILFKISGKKDMKIENLSSIEKEKYEKELKNYTHKVMDNYAKNFNRTINGKELSKDNLVYYGKIEYQRKYTEQSKEVQENRQIKKEIKNLNPKKDKLKIHDLEQKLHKNSQNKIIIEGMKKEGNQTHIHVVVSRYDKEKKTSMSPFANQRKTKDSFGKDIKVGFDRVNFKNENEKTFDKTFEYSREKNESFEKVNANIQKAKIVSKDGKIDGVKVLEGVVELGKLASKLGYTITTGGVGSVKIISPEKLTKKVFDYAVSEVKQEVKKINPFEQLKNKLNPKKVIIKEIKKELGTGGFEKEQ